MRRFTPMEIEEVPEELREVAGRLQPAGRGVPNFLRVLAKSPAAMKAYLSAEEALQRGRLASRQRTEISLAVAEINGSNYCLAAHENAGRRGGLSDEEIRMARSASADDARTGAMLRFVQAIVIQRGEVNDEDVGAIQAAGFSETEIIEVLANVALNVFTNYFNLLVQTEVDYPQVRAEEIAKG